MLKSQLVTLYKFEKEKENKAAQELQLAETDYQQNLQRLSSVGEFRLEYMKRLMDRSIAGIDSATYTHFHAFVAKLDHAASQVEIAIKQAKSLAEHKRKLWLKQRQKVKAVEHLQSQQEKRHQLKVDKQEQAMFDEMATQQFIRRNY